MSETDTTPLERSVQELLRSETKLKSILAGMLDPVLTMNPYGIIQSANDSCLAAFGYEPSELIGQNIKMLMPEPFRSEHDGYLEAYRRTGETHILGRLREFSIVRKDGRVIEIELSVSRIDVPGEEEAVFCGSIRDVSLRKQAERALIESERRFRAIFDGEYQFVGLLAPDGTMLEVNRTALEATGVDREDALGKPFWETEWWSYSAEVQERVKQGVIRAAAGEFVRFDVEVRPRTGQSLTVDFSLKPIRDDEGNVTLIIPEGRDITEIRLAHMREKAMMQAFADIGESASLLAHEIKNPITAVNTALRAVAKHLGEDDQEILNDLVERMKKLESLMRRTLSLAKPLSLQPTAVDISELFGSAAKLMRPHLERDHVSIEVEVRPDCPRITGDPELLEEVLTNLLRNAVDAMDSGGLIRLEASTEGSEVVLHIDDDGPGIPAGILATLFKPFVSTKTNGTGLGLAIGRKVVEAHGGSIAVGNSPLGGARFEIRLPTSP